MAEINLKQPGLTYSACVHLVKTKKESKNLCRQEIQIIFTRKVLVKLVFNMVYGKYKDLDKKLNQVNV